MSKRKYLDAVCVYFWATTPVLMCLLTFGVSVWMGHPLTAASTYTSVALLNMLIGPLNAFPWVLNGLTEAWVSLKRVQELIDITNIDTSSYYTPDQPETSPRNVGATKSIVMHVKDGEFEHQFSRDRGGEDLDQDGIQDFRLIGVNLEIRKGELICVEGPVGGGKSSLLAAILGDLICKRGQIYVQDLGNGFGFVAQFAWLQRGTIRDNILWGVPYDEARYKAVVFACALHDDFAELGGDHVGVGESGRTLSGGQRARIALARGVYQNKAIYLMDDVLSALDAHVAAHVVKHCLLGLLKEKTRIVVSDNKLLLSNAHQIVHVDNGIVTPVTDLVNQAELSDDDLSSLRPRKMRNISLKSGGDSTEGDCDDRQSLDSVMLEETKEQGRLASSVFVSYWRAMTTPIALSVLVTIVTMQASRNLSDAWLAHWVSDTINGTTPPNRTEIVAHDINYYLGIYAGLALTNSVLTLARAFIFAYAGIRAARYIHKRLLYSVFYTKFAFFDVTPLGRILNRFSSDTYTIDDSLPFILNIFLAQLGGLVGALAISLYAMPWLALLVVPLCPIYLSLQNRYRHASRDIKRLSSNALSPLYAHFTETLQGLSTIRAMRGANRFRRNFAVKLEESIRAQVTQTAAQQWLGLRIQILGAILVGGCGVLSAITSAHATNPSFVGLAISYALSITGLLGGLLNAVAETEQELVAVERVNQYCELEEEVNAKGTTDPPFGWPCQGIVTFNDVYLKYRPNLAPALCGVSFETIQCETVGIVGRTGAGKSSILAGLLRITPVWRGDISVDCVNIGNLPLSVLRSRIAIVPQEPFLFAGSVRDNLDPRRYHMDSEIWTAINSCLAAPLVQAIG